jgi:hypothetical protein
LNRDPLQPHRLGDGHGEEAHRRPHGWRRRSRP